MKSIDKQSNKQSDKQLNEEYINIVLNQTNYTRDMAINKLKIYNNDYIKVIKKYLNIPDKEKSIGSLNQQIYKEIRTFLDDK